MRNKGKQLITIISKQMAIRNKLHDKDIGFALINLYLVFVNW